MRFYRSNRDGTAQSGTLSESALVHDVRRVSRTRFTTSRTVNIDAVVLQFQLDYGYMGDGVWSHGCCGNENCKRTRIRQQSCRLESSAKTTDGLVIKNHILLKTAEHTMQHGELRAWRCSGLDNRTFQLVYECILNIGTAGLNAR